MAANFVEVPPNSTGLKVDCTEIVVGANTVERQNICISDPVTAANIATVSAAGALKVDASGATQPISGTATVVQGTGSNLHVVVDTAPTTAVTGTVTAAQATAASLKGEMILLDGAGTNLGTIKAASTAAASTDTSLVVQLNPIQPALTTALNVHDAAPSSQAVTNAGTFVTQSVVTQATGTNLHAVLDTTSTTAVTQATAANLNATVSLAAAQTLATVTAVTAITNALPTGANTIGKVDILGNAGATLDAAINGAASTNALWVMNAPSTASAGACLGKVFSAQAVAVNVKATAGTLYGMAIVSATATAGFVQFFNTATTATTPTVWAIPIAASGTVIITPGTFGLLNFSTGIAINVATPINGTTTQITWTGTIMYI